MQARPLRFNQRTRSAGEIFGDQPAPKSDFQEFDSDARSTVKDACSAGTAESSSAALMRAPEARPRPACAPARARQRPASKGWNTGLTKSGHT
jgi:hypothetical protein